MYVCVCVCMYVCMYMCVYVCIYLCMYVCMCVCMYVFMCVYVCMYVVFKTLFYAVRHLDSTVSYLPTGLHLGFFRSWPSLYLPSSFSCFGIHFNSIMGNLPSAIPWTWPYHVRWFSSISHLFTEVKHKPMILKQPHCKIQLLFHKQTLIFISSLTPQWSV